MSPAPQPLVSVKTIILKTVRDLGLGHSEIPWQDMIEWCAEALQHIGSYSQYTEKEEVLPIHDYKSKLPCDFYRAVPNTFQHAFVGDTLHVSIRSGTVRFRYLALPLDEEGCPLVPDSVQYATALFWKIAMQLSIREELPNKALTFPICKQRWDWYCSQARSKGNFNHQTAKNFSTFWNSPIPSRTNSEEGFNVVDNRLPPHGR